MNFLFPLLLLTSLAVADSSPPRALLPTEPTAADLARARDILTTWEKFEPHPAPRVLRIVYWNPADRDSEPEARARLTRVMLHIQAFYGREMAAWGFPGRSIQLEQEPDGLLKIYAAKGTLPSAECSEQDSSDGQAIRKDALAALQTADIDGEHETMLIFCNLTDWDPAARTISHHSPYYASGDSHHGTAWQVDSALLDSASLAVKDQFLTDGQYGKISLGKYNSIFVGGVCHELGHALGLPHCSAPAAQHASRGTALMGSGNRTYGEALRGESPGTFLTLPHALKLAAHPQFSGSTKGLATQALTRYEHWQLTPTDGGLTVSANVQANLPVHAVIAYADPAGGADYDSQIAAGVPTAEGNFTLTLPSPDKKNCPATLHFVTVCANGAASASVWSAQAFTLPAFVDAAGHYDVTQAQEQLSLTENLAAAQAGQLTPAQVAKLPAKVQEIFRRLALPDSVKGKPRPADVPASTKSISLSDTAPLKAETGWGGVHYDRTPERQPLQGPDGLIPHGLYAHADSSYTYELNGRWAQLTGQCIVLEKGYGNIEGTLLGDDKPLWTSGLIKPGMSKEFNISLAGVKVLTLQTTAKNKSGAWGAWAYPLLK